MTHRIAWRLALGVATSIALAVAVTGQALAVPVYGTEAPLTGSRTTSGGGLLGTLDYNDTTAPLITLSWDIVVNQDGTWTYTYTFSNMPKDVSHFTLDVTDDPACLPGNGCISNAMLDESGTGIFAPIAATDLLFGDIDGILGAVKFDVGGDGSTTSYQFTSDRDPVFGDFCMKDGKGAGGTGPANETCADLPNVTGTNILSNAGFGDRTSEDPLWYIARPDGGRVPPEQVPAPITLVLLGAGFAGLGVAARRTSRSR